jgi:uncharacterized small protein (DUF1192 family)
VNRAERRLLSLADRLEALRREEQLVAGELDMHRHLDEDARRDAAVYETPVERLNARDTGLDVARFERRLAELRSKIERLEAKRARLLSRLA